MRQSSLAPVATARANEIAGIRAWTNEEAEVSQVVCSHSNTCNPRDKMSSHCFNLITEHSKYSAVVLLDTSPSHVTRHNRQTNTQTCYFVSFHLDCQLAISTITVLTHTCINDAVELIDFDTHTDMNGDDSFNAINIHIWRSVMSI